MSQDADHDEDKGGMPPLAKEDELGAHSPADPSSEDPITRSMMFGKLSAEDDTDMERPNDDMPQRLKDLHPYAQILSINDLESCLKLEETVFPPHQACSREKVSLPFLGGFIMLFPHTGASFELLTDTFRMRHAC